MAKKGSSSIDNVTRRITGTGGKGAFSMREIYSQPPANRVKGPTHSVPKGSGTGVQTAIKKIAGDTGKGAFNAREVMTGSKPMSIKHPGFDTNVPPRMDSRHSTTGNPGNTNMNQGGGNRIGKNCRTFKKEAYPTAGPTSSYPRHGGQPSGHKDKA